MLQIIQRYIGKQHFNKMLLALIGIVLILYFNGFSLKSIILIALIIDFSIMAVTDRECRRIPNVCIFIGYGVGLLTFVLYVFNKINIYNSIIQPILGLILIPGILLLITLIFEAKTIGMGDIKAYSVIGFTLGLDLQFLIIFYSLMLYILFGLVIIFKKRTIKFSQPMAPFMYIGVLALMIIGY